MPVFGPQPAGDFNGGRRNDRFVIDPDDLSLVEVSDRGGRGDALRIIDRPGSDAGEFSVEGDLLVWRPFERAGAVEIALAGGVSPIEYLEWERLPEDGAPYLHRMRIVTDTDAPTGSNFAAAGTQGDDVIDAQDFARFRGGWSEVYGNGGDDRLVGSNRHAVYLYGGDDDDTLIGAGRFDDYFYGDADDDILRGNRGDDGLYGGGDDDRIYGGRGNDSLFGDAGNDTLSGGTGDDEFVYWVGAGSEGTDRISGFEIGGDRVILDGYAPGSSILSLRAVSGGIEVTLLETGTRVVFEGLTSGDIQANAAAIFEIV